MSNYTPKEPRVDIKALGVRAGGAGTGDRVTWWRPGKRTTGAHVCRDAAKRWREFRRQPRPTRQASSGRRGRVPATHRRTESGHVEGVMNKYGWVLSLSISLSTTPALAGEYTVIPVSKPSGPGETAVVPGVP